MPYDPYKADERRDSRYMNDDKYRRMREAEDDEYEYHGDAADDEEEKETVIDVGDGYRKMENRDSKDLSRSEGIRAAGA